MAVITRSLPAAAAALLAACTVMPSGQDPVLVKLTDLESRLIRVERVIENQALLDMQSELEQLRAELRQLRGEVETVRHDQDRSRKQQRDLYVDVDRRVQALEKGTAGLALGLTGSGSAAPGIPSSATERGVYQGAFDQLKEARYPEAIAGFTNFLEKFPDSPLADNAQYWLAESHYVTREFQTALAAFQQLAAQYPKSSKLPDATLKIGYCHYELGQWREARQALNQVVQSYPDSTVGGLATKRLQRMTSEGH